MKIISTTTTAQHKAESAKINQKQSNLEATLSAIAKGVGYSSDQSLAAYFNASRSTIWHWSRIGKLPKPIKLSEGMSRWSNEEIKEWSKEAM
jgi:prophage regulatory protein